MISILDPLLSSKPTITTSQDITNRQSKLVELLLSSPRRVGKSYSEEETLSLHQQITNKITTNDELFIALVAFPFKIQNPLKTEGRDPDLGEQIALQRMAKLSSEASDIGFDLHRDIITDGKFYADELGVSESVVDRYTTGIQKMADEAGLNVSFTELNDLISGKESLVSPMSFEDEQDRTFILRTAGMINSLSYKDQLFSLFEQTQSVNQSIEMLVTSDTTFRKQAEQSATIYQAKKKLVEESNMFNTVFSHAIRASIQPDPNRNLKDFSIERPLSIRITESKTKNLFPRLGVPCFKKEYFNMFLAEALLGGYYEP